MRASVHREAAVAEKVGHRPENPIVAGAPETMNFQCAVLDLLKVCGESARVYRAKADELDRAARNVALAWSAHRDSIARYERRRKAVA